MTYPPTPSSSSSKEENEDVSSTRMNIPSDASENAGEVEEEEEFNIKPMSEFVTESEPVSYPHTAAPSTVTYSSVSSTSQDAHTVGGDEKKPTLAELKARCRSKRNRFAMLRASKKGIMNMSSSQSGGSATTRTDVVETPQESVISSGNVHTSSPDNNLKQILQNVMKNAGKGNRKKQVKALESVLDGMNPEGREEIKALLQTAAMHKIR